MWPGRGRRAGPVDLCAPLIEALDEPAALCDLAGRIRADNPAWRAAVGEGVGSIGGAGVFRAFRTALAQGRGAGFLGAPADREAIVARLGDGAFLVRLRPPAAAAAGEAPATAPVAAAIPDDMQEALQSQLAQRAKMEAVGQLAGGVAHDFNNLLTAIRLRVEDLLQRHPLGDPDYEPLSEISATVSRAAGVVRQLLTFSRKATVRREILDLGETLVDVEVLLRRLLRETIALETRYDRDLPPVRADRSQIETAVVNLVVNARDAIGETGTGVVRLSARRVTPAEATDLGYVGQATGDMAMIEVSDSGPGVPSQVLEHIFDPFFTTKAAGHGAGLGLATVYGIVKQAEGAILVQSPPGEGARFRIFLPACPPALQVGAPPHAGLGRSPSAPVGRDLSGRGRILLVEDEILVRGIIARLLRGRGYDVLEAADGEAALDVARAHAGEIDLMISDVTMPGMDGPALLEAAQPFLGGAPVIFISGYAEAEVSDLLEDQTQVSFLAKPLDIASLAEHVKHRLDGARQASRGDA